MKPVSAHVEKAVLTVCINRAEKRNPLSRAVLDEIRHVFGQAADDHTLTCAVLRGDGSKSFASGGDLKELANVKGAEAAREMAENAKRALAAVRGFPLPVVAALNGDALGGGAELAMACDIRLAAPHVRIGFIQGRLAITSAWGGGVDLMRLLGPAAALQLLARSEMLDAEDARALGLVNAIAETNQSFEDAIEDFIAPMRRQSPHVMRAFKALTLPVRVDGRKELDDIETGNFSAAWAHPDHDAAVARAMNKKKAG